MSLNLSPVQKANELKEVTPEFQEFLNELREEEMLEELEEIRRYVER